METPVPVSIQPLIDAYLHALKPLRAHFYGIYIAGSIQYLALDRVYSFVCSRIARSIS
jgi:hypothetical protein